MLPADVAAVLPAGIDRERVSAHARLHAAIDSPLGESHLVRCDARTLAISRRSPFEPFAVVELTSVRYEKATFSRTLFLETAAGAKHTMDVSILDVDAIEAFTHDTPGAVAPPAPRPDVAVAVPIAFTPKIGSAPKIAFTPPVVHDASLQSMRRALVDLLQRRVIIADGRSMTRAKFLSVLRARVKRRSAEPEPFPRHERYVAPVLPTRSEPQPQPREKKKHAKPVAKRSDHLQHAPPPEQGGPLFRTGHWIAMLVLAPLIFYAFVMLSRALR